jgi:hypothetical protein
VQSVQPAPGKADSSYRSRRRYLAAGDHEGFNADRFALLQDREKLNLDSTVALIRTIGEKDPALIVRVALEILSENPDDRMRSIIGEQSVDVLRKSLARLAKVTVRSSFRSGNSKDVPDMDP